MDFQGSINLMKLKGTQCLTVTMPDGRQLRGTFIPADYNDMIRINKQTNKEEIAPYINLRVRAAGKEFIDGCLRRHAGEENYRTPSHTVDISFGKEFRERALASAIKRVQTEHPELSVEDATKEAKRALYITLGTLTPVEMQEAGGYSPVAAVATAVYPQPAPMQYNTPQPQEDASLAPAPIDDLPF